MSRFEMYAIRQDGEVVRFGEASNAHAAVPWIWTKLAEKIGVPDPLSPYAKGADRTKLWSLEPSLASPDRELLRFSFDAAWVKSSNAIRLTKILETFWRANRYSHGHEITPTLLEVCILLREIVDRSDLAAACWNVTSVNRNPWVVDDPDGQSRPYVFGQDAADINGATPLEVFGHEWLV